MCVYVKKLKTASTQIMQFRLHLNYLTKTNNVIDRSKFLVNILQSSKLHQLMYQHIIPSIA